MTSVPCQEPPNRSGSLERRNSGCGWLRIRVFLARICRDLPMQVFDLLDYHEGHMKFEIRHSPFPTSILTGCCVCDASLTRRSPISSL